LSIFLEDTHLRLEDKLVPLFAEALSQRYGACAEAAGHLRCERRHLYSVPPPRSERNGHGPIPPIFIFSSRPSLEANLAYCLRRLLVPGPLTPAAAEALMEAGDPTLPPEPPPPASEASDATRTGSGASGPRPGTLKEEPR
jgi:hypothetical protein